MGDVLEVLTAGSVAVLEVGIIAYDISSKNNLSNGHCQKIILEVRHVVERDFPYSLRK